MKKRRTDKVSSPASDFQRSNLTNLISNSFKEGRALTKKNHIILIGPIPVEEDVIGGTKVSFMALRDELTKNDTFQITTISTSRGLAGLGRLKRAFINLQALVKVFLKLWRSIGGADLVMWNVSSGGALSSGFLFWTLARFYRKPFILRLFASDFDTSYRSANWCLQQLAKKTILKSDIILLQTKTLLQEVSETLPNLKSTKWYPTTRDMPSRKTALPERCANILFLSQLKEEKGVPEILAASLNLGKEVHFNILGPSMDGYEIGDLSLYPNVTLGGAISIEKVPEVLQKNDALILPSKRQAEGYPGIVIEALQMGLPIIATSLPSLREIVKDRENGLLVEPGSSEEIEKAIRLLSRDDKLFRSMSEKAQTSGNRFRGSELVGQLERWIFELVE